MQFLKDGVQTVKAASSLLRTTPVTATDLALSVVS